MERGLGILIPRNVLCLVLLAGGGQSDRSESSTAVLLGGNNHWSDKTYIWSLVDPDKTPTQNDLFTGGENLELVNRGLR